MTELFNVICNGVEETEAAGVRLAELIKNDFSLPDFIALCGGLGAGKTAFTRGFCSVLCPSAAVRSPSFALVNEYKGSTDVFHFDVWRITDDDDLYSTGFYDYCERGGIVICEWANNIDYALPDRYIKVEIDGNGDLPRKITVTLENNNENIGT